MGRAICPKDPYLIGWITLGSTEKSHILVVANLFFSDDGEEVIRIISARLANNKERDQYENT